MNKYDVKKPGSRLPPSASVESRKNILVALNKAYDEAKTDAEAWIDVDTIKKVLEVKMLTSSLLRLRLIETKRDGDKLLARITQYGRYAVEHKLYTYNDLQKTIQIPSNIHERLNQIALELGVMRATGRGAGEVPSVVGLVLGIVEKPDAFKRWWKSNYDEGDK